MIWILLAMLIVNTEAGSFHCVSPDVDIDAKGVPSAKNTDGTMEKCTLVVDKKEAI